MTSSPPPLALRLAAALSIVFGTVSIVGMVVSLLRGSFSLDFGFVGIPIGRGLLVGRHSSRSWAIALSGLGFLLVVAIAGWRFYSGQFHAGTRAHLWLSGIHYSLQLLVCGTVFFGLRSPSVRAWFTADSPSRVDGLGWTTPLVLVGALFAAVSATREYITETYLAGLFPIHTRVEFRDASTGGPINNIRYSSDGLTLFSTGRRDAFAPRISVGSTAYSDGLSVALSFTGFSGRPVDVTFTSKGYRPSKYTLNDKSPEEVTLSLQPSK